MSPCLQILHLEDNLADYELVQVAVKIGKLACQLTPAATREEFVKALEQGKFDVILADCSLPGYDGAAALAQARELQPDTPFIFVSGTLGEERAVEILKEGATDCVLKTRLSRLVPAIRRAVQESQEREWRRQAEDALRQSEERFREMAEYIREMFWSASTDGRQIHYVSPAYEQIWKLPLAGLYARPLSWLEQIWLEDKPRVVRARELVGHGTAYSLEYRILQPDGTCRWIEEHGYPVRGPLGQVERMVGVSLDITERKQLEEQLQQAQKIDAIGQLAGGIAHDFSNVLTVINGYSNLLLDNHILPPAVAESLKHIYVAGGRAANLTRQLLIFSRKSFAHHQSIDLNEVIDVVTAMLTRMIGEHIRLELDLAHPLPRIFADTSMLEQILMNLVVNARDAMPKGGSLVISTGSCETTAADCKRNPEAQPGAHAWLSVQDTGCGIPPEVLPRIFEPFFTTKEEGKGTGLGLANVFSIAKQHQGWVEVESEVGAGTLFRVFLPVAQEQSAETPSSPENFLVQGGKEVILLVEDEEPVRAYARTVLQMHGYKVLEASSGVDALDVWKRHRDRIALLLTDLVMPDEMTGLELSEKLRAERPGLKVLFSSGYNPEMAEDVLKSQSGFSFLHKPYQPKTLARMVREILDKGTVTATSPSQTPFG